MKKRLLASAIGLMIAAPLSFGAEPSKIGPQPHKAEIVLTESNTIVFRDIFTSTTVAEATLKARAMDASLPPGQPMYLVIDSPGGEIDAGIEFIENLNSLNHKVVTLTQFAASMGFQTVQGISGERLILANGTLMSHKAKGGFEGEFAPNGGQLNTRFAYYLKRVERMDKRAVERTHGQLTLKEYEDLIRDEYWCDGQDCVDKGFADKVVNATCDETLSGSRETVITMPFMGMTVQLKAKVSKCPLVTGLMKPDGASKIFVDGQEYSPSTFSSVKSDTLRVYITKEFEKTTDELTQIAAGTYRRAEKY